ncbi:MAG: hypothetical protein COV10_02830 [Candidatus Vogelbacteria bacterium CG10_big_fil_rev_8_21_14_0_10_51_16]|uniref:Uncharacterized protein n=1 Tax=Candidatus Vogelbacteria bacterium CG10_big_fil_rev_8_21_14_0_10_51_16 TaxID=1975045 RepID=A0A2H0RE76_9BACT|nr:MAG: hypothetical protein COV10_02830 [Candidatus Vogelbacteria bacterium CG10_big_fil_rev_8_21_14_0_10_51_16]
MSFVVRLLCWVWLGLAGGFILWSHVSPIFLCEPLVERLNSLGPETLIRWWGVHLVALITHDIPLHILGLEK